MVIPSHGILNNTTCVSWVRCLHESLDTKRRYYNN